MKYWKTDRGRYELVRQGRLNIPYTIPRKNHLTISVTSLILILAAHCDTFSKSVHWCLTPHTLNVPLSTENGSRVRSILHDTACRRYSKQWFPWRSIYVAFLSALIGIPFVVSWKAQKLWRSVYYFSISEELRGKKEGRVLTRQWSWWNTERLKVSSGKGLLFGSLRTPLPSVSEIRYVRLSWSRIVERVGYYLVSAKPMQRYLLRQVPPWMFCWNRIVVLFWEL